MIKRLLFFLFITTILCSCKSQLYHTLYSSRKIPSAQYPNMVLISGGRLPGYVCKYYGHLEFSSFCFSQFEITNAQYVFFLNDIRDTTDFYSHPLSEFIAEDSLHAKVYTNAQDSFFVKKGYENYPVTNVTLSGAEQYAFWLTRKTSAQFTKKKYQHLHSIFRIPSEVEWYYALGITDTTQLDKSAWYKDNTDSTHAVGQKQPNAAGLYDMQGNAAEWCHVYIQINDIDGWSMFRDHYQVTCGGSYHSSSEEILAAPCTASRVDSTRRDVGFRIMQLEINKNSSYY